MSCQACDKPKQGRYNFACVACCARLVVSARGHGKAKERQEVFLYGISKYKNAPSRAQILDYVKENHV